MKFQRLLLAFITITAVGYLYDKYQKKYEEDPKERKILD